MGWISWHNIGLTSADDSLVYKLHDGPASYALGTRSHLETLSAQLSVSALHQEYLQSKAVATFNNRSECTVDRPRVGFVIDNYLDFQPFIF
jgi:hypothetical protein